MKERERAKRWASGEGYNRYITSELNSFRKKAWKEQICSHFEGAEGLQILDVGTGPGFFACILSEEGHNVTAIDNSDGMLKQAVSNAAMLGVFPTFIHMDVNRLKFKNDTFDAVVSRNVTWTLEKPDQVYAELKRILKPGGKLLIYDANWHLHFYDEKLMKKVREREQYHLERYGTVEIVAENDMEYYNTAPLTRIVRPKWDVDMLKKRLGMKVSVQEDIGKNVYEVWEKELYAESPLFEICAVKQ